MKNRTLPSWIAGGAILLLVVATATAAENPNTIAEKAYELRLAGQVEEAVQLLEDGLSEQPQAAVLHYEMARAKLYLFDFPAMQREAEAAALDEPENPKYHYFAALASCYSLIDAAHHQDEERMKTFSRQAIDELEAALASDPDYHQARFMLVQLSVEMARDEGVKVEDTEPHVRLLEEKDPILGAKARCCLVDEKEKKKIWDKILTDYPEDPRALFEAAEGLIEVGDLERASECLEKAIQKNKENCYGLLRLGLAYTMQEDWDRAMGLTQRYLLLEPPVALKAFAMDRLGRIHSRMGDEAKSRELIQKARELDPHVWQTFMPPPQEIFVSP